MSIPTEPQPDIFYKVKKQILDKLDLILQKVNLQIINSMDFQYESKGSSSGRSRRGKTNDDFTFIELSHFQGEISALFDYLDKLYQSLNSSVSGYASYGNNSHASLPELHQTLQKLQTQNKKIQSENDHLKKSFESKLKKYESKLSQSKQTQKKYKEKLTQLLIQIKRQPQEIQLLKKYINGKFKQYKFEMLETRVEILSAIKECQYGWGMEMETRIMREKEKDKEKEKQRERQRQRQRQRQKEKEKGASELACHHISQDQLQIINQLNQILKMC